LLVALVIVPTGLITAVGTLLMFLGEARVNLVMGILMLIVGPILFVVGLLVFGVLAMVFALPLLPLLAVVALVWFLARSNRRPAVA
jgi:hypothetical protein